MALEPRCLLSEAETILPDEDTSEPEMTVSEAVKTPLLSESPEDGGWTGKKISEVGIWFKSVLSKTPCRLKSFIDKL